MEAVTTRVFIPSSPDNLHVITSMAAEDPELRAAMIRDAKEGKTFGGYVSRANRSARASIISGGTAGKVKIGTRDSVVKPKHTESMNNMTRDELSHTLSAIEERMDKRVERMASEFQREMALRDEATQREASLRQEALTAHIGSNDAAVRQTLDALVRVEKDFSHVKQSNKEQRYWMAGIGVAIVLGIMGANATIFSGGKAFFDGGMDRAAVMSVLEETKEQTRQARDLLQHLQAQQAASRAVSEPSNQPARPQQ